MLTLIYIFGHVLTVNNRCYGRCYETKLIPLCTFLKFSTYIYLEVNSARSIQNTFYKCLRALNLIFFKNCVFSQCRHFFFYYRATLKLEEQCPSHTIRKSKQEAANSLTTAGTPSKIQLLFKDYDLPPNTRPNLTRKSRILVLQTQKYYYSCKMLEKTINFLELKSALSLQWKAEKCET